MLIKTTGAIIKNDHGKFLLQLRSNDAPSCRNQWLLFGGHDEEGETPLESLTRELKEELGITFVPERFEYLGKINSINEDGFQAEENLFKTFIRPDEKIKLNEGANYGFFTKEEALTLPTPDFMRGIMEKYF